VSATSIVAYGESLGAGQAVRLAAKRPVAAVVLERRSPPQSMWRGGPIFGCRLVCLITDKYNNERNVRSVTAPISRPAREQDAVIRWKWACGLPRRQRAEADRTVSPGRPLRLFDHGAWEKTRAFLASLADSRDLSWQGGSQLRPSPNCPGTLQRSERAATSSAMTA